MIARTKSALLSRGSVKEDTLTEMELIEYRQTGMIRAKWYPPAEDTRLKYSKQVNYYDFAENQKGNIFFDLDFLT